MPRSHSPIRSLPGAPLRVGFLIDTLQPGGGTENQLILLLRHLDRRRVEPALCCLWDNPALATLAIDCPIEILGFERLLSMRGVLGMRALRAWVRREGLNVLVTFFLEGNQVGLLATRGMRLPLLSSRRNLGEGYWHTRWQLAKLRLLNRWSTGFITNSEAVRRYTCVAEGVAPERIALIHNALDTEIFRPPQDRERTASRDQLGTRPEQLAVGCVSNLRRIKGVDVLVEAWPHVIQKLPEAVLVLVGAGSEQEAMVARSRGLGVADSVRFLGRRHDVPELLRGLDLAVLPSRGESYSNSLLEYMASGLAAVATSVGGNEELISSPELGRLVPSEDPVALAGAIVELGASASLREKIGRAARRVAVEHHALPTILEHWYEVLEGTQLSDA